MSDIIQLRNLNFAYQEETPILKDVSLNVTDGEWLAIIGHNGSGKSTLAKTINGLLAPQSGQVWVDGILLSEETLWDVRSKVNMVFQNPDNQFVGVTVEDDVAFGLENQGMPREQMLNQVQSSLKKVGMWQFRDRDPASLSGGQKQRVAIASVIALTPKVIILDEATSMLDPRGRLDLINQIRQLKEEYNLTVISITHDIDEAALADRIVVIKEGEVAQQGTPEEIFSYGEELIEMGLDVPFADQLRRSLKAAGLDITDQYLTEEGLVTYLCKLLSME